VTSNGALGLLDKGLVATLPSHFGYCVYFEAQMEPARLPGRASESLPSTVEP
jgi:hypothetical protein